MNNLNLSEYENFYHDKYGYCYYEMGAFSTPIIYGLFVEPEYRRSGHACRLLNEVIKILRAAGYTNTIHIQAAPGEDGIDRDRLVAFYESLGLTVIP